MTNGKQSWIFRQYLRFLKVLTFPAFLHEHLFARQVGRGYDISWGQKLKLCRQIFRNARLPQSATNWREHFFLVQQILKCPPDSPGVVVECGCFQGGCTASLSLACALTGRKLVVFDSFCGLPEPTAVDAVHYIPKVEQIHTYVKGSFAAGLSDVKNHITKYGDLSVCVFVPGYFDDTMVESNDAMPDAIVVAFLDVDLRSSLETCVRSLWSRVQLGGVMCTHEAGHIEIAALFFDDRWWKDEIGETAPGLIGAASGVSYAPGFATGIGYITKRDPATYKVVPQDHEDGLVAVNAPSAG